jgi:hypothetical protein
MNNARRAKWGRRAVKRGNPDHKQNDFLTSAGDTIANVLHAVNQKDGLGAVEHALDSALLHFYAEHDEESIDQEGED